MASKGWHQSIDSAGGRTGRVSPHGKQFRFLDDIHGGDDEDVKAGLDPCAAYLVVPNYTQIKNIEIWYMKYPFISQWHIGPEN